MGRCRMRSAMNFRNDGGLDSDFTQPGGFLLIFTARLAQESMLHRTAFRLHRLWSNAKRDCSERMNRYKRLVLSGGNPGVRG
ncbi:MAG: hypothetical protein OXC41_06780 [Gammaproteobacteria bacterium]|nr:hypothetical protein [Gammaproteobacteria bacterium]